MIAPNDMPVTAIANWFGSARMVADRIEPELAGCSLVVVPFAGGMSELPYIDAAKLLVNDRHRHVINLARVIGDSVLMPKLLGRLQTRIFHPDELAAARLVCARFEQARSPAAGLFGIDPAAEIATADARLEWAEAYFIATWMSRGGNSGTRAEFRGKLSVRYSPDGGGSAQRFWGAVGGIQAWHRVLGRCEFTTDDAFDVLDKTHDSPKVGIYCDPPWPDAGDGYANAFSVTDQRRLARKLATFKVTRVVVRFGDHPLIRELYPTPHWTWHTYPSRTQHNGEFAEVLLVNNSRPH